MAQIKKIFNALDALKMSTRLFVLAILTLFALAWMTFAADSTVEEIAISGMVMLFFGVLSQSMLRSFNNARKKEVVLHSLSNNVMIADKNDILGYMNDISKKSLTDLEQDIQTDYPEFTVKKAIGSSIHKMHKNPERVKRILRGLQPGEIHTGNIHIGGQILELNVSGIFDNGKRLGSYAEWSNVTTAKETRELKEMMDSSLNSLNANVMIANRNDELTWMNEASYRSLRELQGEIQKSIPDFNVDKAMGASIHNMHKDPERVKRILHNMKPGDSHTGNIYLGDKVLELIVRPLFSGDERIGGYAEWQDKTEDIKFQKDKQALEENIRTTAVSVNEASSEIAEGNINLSERTEAQAANIEQTTASMQLITEKVEENAKTAEEALSLVNNASDIADKGGMVVASAMEAMEEISQSSTEINNIISVVDEIAFQTNLLALNAAVEAARAGEQGRGFAVVASEVRTLAGRSATAAKEIKELISKSGNKVASGTEQVNSTGDTLNQIIENVKDVAERVERISSGSREQAEGVSEVNKAVQQMDAFTQQNAALVEEAASASKSLEEQAEHMIKLVDAEDVESEPAKPQPLEAEAAE